MKTLCAFKNRRLPHALLKHGMTPDRIFQIGILLNECFHAHTVPKIGLI